MITNGFEHGVNKKIYRSLFCQKTREFRGQNNEF